MLLGFSVAAYSQNTIKVPVTTTVLPVIAVAIKVPVTLNENDRIKVPVTLSENDSETAVVKRQDPTRPPSGAIVQLAEGVAVVDDYRLTAIFTRNNRQYAVVNGEVYTRGDRFSGMSVIEITHDSLTLNDIANKESKVLKLRPSISVKKQVEQ